MNTLFAWAAFVFLAGKNGRQVVPETRIGRISIASLPTGAEALARLSVGDRVTAVNGRPVHSWDDLTRGLVSGAGRSVSITVNDSLSVALPIPPDALERRAEAAQALAPWMPAVVDLVQPSWPAARAGVQPGDTIVAVDGKPMAQWYDLVDVLQASPGKELAMEVGRAGGRTLLHVTPERYDTAGKTIGRVGIGPHVDVVATDYSLAGAVGAGTEATAEAALTIVRTIQGLATRRISAKNLGGPIMIGQIAAQSARLGLDAFLGVLGLISINLALLNLLPIPVFDGGQAVFLLYEAVVRRPMPLRLREALMLVGIALVVLLMLLANWNDVRRIFGW
jgi:regulator of sigma E protease